MVVGTYKQFLGLAQKKMFCHWYGYSSCALAGQKCDGFDEKTFPRNGGGRSAVPVGWSRRIASQRRPTTDGKRTIAYYYNMYKMCITTVWVCVCTAKEFRDGNSGNYDNNNIITAHDDRDCAIIVPI